MTLKFNLICFLPFLGLSLFTACKTRTIEPIVPAGERVVLIEEFTGKGCTNCPKGSRELENLISIFQDQLVVVSIHAGFFANPQFFPLGQYDLRTDEGEEIFDLLGPNLGYPSGVINRRKVNGDYQLGANVWAGIITQEAAIDPQIEFTIQHTYQEDSRHLHLIVEGRAKVEIPEELRISIMITESGIIDAQDDAESNAPNGIVEDYVHKHVLRDMVTPYDGQILATALLSGEEFMVEFEYTVPSGWVAAECNVIAFISLNSGSGDLTVLQAGEVHLTE